MRRGDWEDRCKRHPEHRQSMGICPNCLRERLSRLSAASSSANTTHASSSPYSSASPTSPPDNHPHPFLDADAADPRCFSMPLGPLTQAASADGPDLQKSRSLALETKLKQPAEDSKADREQRKKKKKKKMRKPPKLGKFFSRLIVGLERDGNGKLTWSLPRP